MASPSISFEQQHRRFIGPRESSLVLLLSICALPGCGGSDNPSGNAGGSASVGGARQSGGGSALGGGASTGGKPSDGGSGTKNPTGGATGLATGGSVSTGGQNPSLGGKSATGGGASTGGRSSAGGSGAKTGGAPGTGGKSSTTTTAGGGNATGGNAAGGAATGGALNSGGASAIGGRSATGGASGAVGGTSAAGGAATGGTSATGGGSSCPFPTTFKWKDYGGPLAQPKNGWVSLKDFSSVVSNGQHIIYSSMHDDANYGSQMMVFKDWPDAATATQTKLSTSTVAPTIFYFTPKKLWILAYQWCSAKFCYATSSDATKADSWSFGHNLLTEDITNAQYGPIDQTVICDSTNCYLFYAGDNGHIYRASMPIDSFPGNFSGSKDIIAETTSTVFEAVQVYAVKGTGKYLMIVETNTSPRFFRAYSADSLGGTFTVIPGASSQSTPFAGKNNVTFTGTPWTNDISHGDLVRENPDETFTVDPCNMQLLYQGRDPNQNPSYDLLPYRPGLLTRITN